MPGAGFRSIRRGTPPEVTVEGLKVKDGFSISHENEYGAFAMVAYDDANIDWLMDTHLGRSISFAFTA
jgi:hypothetical protein